MDDALSDAFGDAFGVDDGTAASKQQRREARFRAAFDNARATYEAKQDTDAWFFQDHVRNKPTAVWDADEMDTKTTARLCACTTYLYFQGRYEAAYAWSTAMLGRLHVVSEADAWEASIPVQRAMHRDKTQKALASSSFAREMLDTVLRCMLHLHTGRWTLSAQDIAMIAAGFEKIRLAPTEYAGLHEHGIPNDNALKTCIWTPLPGLAVTVGDVCSRCGRYDSALEAYALALGVRIHWRTMRSAACALSRLCASTGMAVYKVTAQAALACALQSCPLAQRVFLQNTLLPAHLPMPLTGAAQSVLADPHAEDAMLHALLHATLRNEAALALYVALRSRGGIYLLSMRLPFYLSPSENSSWTADDDNDVAGPRSVKTL
ncbi:hypothetical protein MVES1_001815 [Malassezia vespertilionis]|uniref:uncharacterized protein n=1 Tax=Malassezia vespertilionis TaxID=2020962 RepID=UPI0024B15820|nr:uncharacterized protein MVES1_001815 [Malassezia vespertilionis]WFD06470.1 hypothetical protein MVES1_001815 [Malassezia vespertilionis]